MAPRKRGELSLCPPQRLPIHAGRELGRGDRGGAGPGTEKHLQRVHKSGRKHLRSRRSSTGSGTLPASAAAHSRFGPQHRNFQKTSPAGTLSLSQFFFEKPENHPPQEKKSPNRRGEKGA